MKTTIENITPKMAESILEKHWVKEHQRKPLQSTVDLYARAMMAGQWKLNHQGIAIDDAGELIDGVHRLLAIVQSGVTIPLMVTRELPNNGNNSEHPVAESYVIDTIDRNRPRAVGQQLQLRHGYKNGEMHAAIARQIMRACLYSISTSDTTKLLGRATVANALVVLDEYRDEVRFCVDNRSYDYGIRSAAVIASAVFAMKACKKQIEDFYLKLATGEELRTGDPALTCRRWLQSDNNTFRGESFKTNRAVLTCAMKHVRQEQIKVVIDSAHGYNFFLEKQRGTVLSVLRTCKYVE
jgi:hypothetical protein